MKRVLLDTNVVLDLLLNRPPWAADAATIWDAHRTGTINAFVAAYTVPTIFYIVRRNSDLATAQKAVADILATLDVTPVDRSTLLAAGSLPGSDFEDNLQIPCAVQSGLDGIITRDPGGFSGSAVPVLSPAELVARLAGPATP